MSSIINDIRSSLSIESDMESVCLTDGNWCVVVEISGRYARIEVQTDDKNVGSIKTKIDWIKHLNACNSMNDLIK